MFMNFAKKTLKVSEYNNIGYIGCQSVLVDLYSSTEVYVFSIAGQGSHLNIYGNRNVNCMVISS